MRNWFSCIFEFLSFSLLCSLEGFLASYVNFSFYSLSAQLLERKEDEMKESRFFVSCLEHITMYRHTHGERESQHTTIECAERDEKFNLPVHGRGEESDR
jgi:hypothetical protein